MRALHERQIELPDPNGSGGSIVWNLSQRGLEWEGGRSRAAWMPFACMRRITLGNVKALGGWRMRVSGPPGSVLIGASHHKTPSTPEMTERFSALASAVIREAGQRGCPPKFRLNGRHILPAIAWSLLGTNVPDYGALLSMLEVSPK